MISDSDEEEHRGTGGEADNEEDSTDELDLIGDGHEDELLAESHALLVLSVCRFIAANIITVSGMH